MTHVERIQLTYLNLEEALIAIRERMQRARYEKGNGAFVSQHETLGCITQEYHELVPEKHRQFEDELLDLAVACWWGVASEMARREQEIESAKQEAIRHVQYTKTAEYQNDETL